MQLKNRKTFVILCISIITGPLLLLLSLLLMAKGTETFDTGQSLSIFHQVAYYSGYLISGYLLLPMYFLSFLEKIYFLSGVLSYISSMSMVFTSIWFAIFINAKIIKLKY